MINEKVTEEEKKEAAEKAANRVKLNAEKGFFGTLVLHYRAGYIYHSTEEKSLKF
jgi:hypothetical protein